MMEKQIRLTQSDEGQLRTDTVDEKLFFQGYASIFNRTTDLGYFVESIHPEAFNSALARQDDVRALFNHDTNLILGRTKSGTLRLSVDEIGLVSKIEIPDTTLGRDLKVYIERGDISQMSFGFVIEKEEKRGMVDEKPWYEIQQVRLFDVSPVTFPAYEQTSIEVTRSLESRTADIVERENRFRSVYKLRARKINLLKYSIDFN